MAAIAERTFSVQALAIGPALRAAMVEAGDLIRGAWLEELLAHADTGETAKALEDQGALQYPYLNDPHVVAVVNPRREADWLEEGREGFHLPERINPLKWKLAKNGTKYLTIPFRHTTPATPGGGASSGRLRMQMSREVYGLAKQLQDRERLSTSMLSSALEAGDRAPLGAELYKQSKSYTYYREIFGAAVPDTLPEGYTWKASPYENLQRNTRETPGGGRHTEYMTWRTLTSDSEGFFIPPTPAHHLAARAMDAVAPAIEELLDAAAAADFAQAIADATRGLFE